MQKILLTPDIYLAATMAGGGPPAALFNALVGKRDSHPFIVSPWIQEQIKEGMIKAGYDEAKAVDQANFITSLGKTETDSGASDDPMVDLAKTAGVDKVYCIGERAGTETDGIQFSPVSELITMLQG